LVEVHCSPGSIDIVDLKGDLFGPSQPICGDYPSLVTAVDCE